MTPEDFLASRDVLAPVFARHNPIGRNLLPPYAIGPGDWLRCRGRRVALRRGATPPMRSNSVTNLAEAIVVLAVDLGCPTVRHAKGSRRARLELQAAAAALLALGLVDSPQDDPDHNGSEVRR